MKEQYKSGSPFLLAQKAYTHGFWQVKSYLTANEPLAVRILCLPETEQLEGGEICTCWYTGELV